MRPMILAVLAPVLVVFLASPADARCIFKFCQTRAETSRSYIVNQHRQKVGDLYSPGHGRRLQIRNNSRQILGTIKTLPTGETVILNNHRQRVGKIFP